jgi:hypothetical protein
VIIEYLDSQQAIYYHQHSKPDSSCLAMCAISFTHIVLNIWCHGRPFNSEIELTLKKKSTAPGSAAAAVQQPATVTLRRTRPVPRETLVPDAERFRAYLLGTGFWLSPEGSTFDPAVLDSKLSRFCLFLSACCCGFQARRFYSMPLCDFTYGRTSTA